MTFKERLCIYLAKKINNERSISGLIHILNGKKSVQSVQDSHIFGLKKFYSLFPNNYTKLIKDDLINKFNNDLKNKQDYIQDEIWYKLISNNFSNKNVIVFWKRLNLLIQVSSNYYHRNNKYYPVQVDKDVQFFIKKFVLNVNNLDNLSDELHNDLSLILKNLPELYCRVFVDKLSGSKSIGKTFYQIAKENDLDEIEVYLIFISVLHFILDSCYENLDKYLIIPFLMKNLYSDKILTKSSNETFSLVKQGFDIKTISKIRGLKINTIEDHIVECALFDKTFDINQYVNESNQKMIKDVIKNTNTFKLKEIKDHLSECISYFQIRLVLARKEDD